MEKEPTKANDKPARKTAVKAPSKTPAKLVMKSVAKAIPKAPKLLAKPAAKAPAAKAVDPLRTRARANPAKATPSEPAHTSLSIFKETSSKISELAADILADRIVPTLEQIKAIAASVLEKGKSKGQKGKTKKKKK